MAMLNAQDRYTTPALAPATFNVISIAVGAGLYIADVPGYIVAIGWSIGTILGGLSQLCMLIPPLWRLGYRPKLSTDSATSRSPYTKRVGKLMLPAVGGLARGAD